MRRFRRAVSVLLCLALIVCLCPASDATGIIFLAVNDTIPISISAGTMPFWSNGLLYVPSGLFDVTALNIVPNYNSAAGVLTVSSGSRSLTFDLNQGTMTNESGVIFTAQVISRGGVLFVPVIYCVYHFGLSMSELTSLGGYTVFRFTTGAQVYDDELFIEKADNLIEYRVGQYLGEAGGQPPSDEPAQPPDNPPSSDAPGGEDGPSDDPEEPPDETPPAEIYLAVTGAARMPDALEALEAVGLKAAFFFTCDEIGANADLILRLYADGHTIGLLADAEEAAANDALDRILQTRALCRLLEAGTRPAAGVGRTFTYSAADQPEPGEAAQLGAQPQLYVVGSADVAQTLAEFRSAGANLHLLRETSPV